MDALVIESLFPRSTLELMLNSLLKSRRLLIYGATGIGKSNLAKYLAKYLSLKLKTNFFDVRYPENSATDSQTDSIKTEKIQEELIQLLKNNTNDVILLDNIQRKRIDLIQEALIKTDSETDSIKLIKPFLIATLNRTSDSLIQKLNNEHKFMLLPLNSKMDAVKGKIFILTQKYIFN